jgi:dipeptidyl aminopeptidase/acylaminoacyl peptidase
LAVEDALAMRSFAGRSYAGISPDGCSVCYTLREQSRRRPVEGPLYENYSRKGVSVDIAECSAWVSDVASGNAVCLGKREASTWAPVWSPDGGSLAFFSDQAGVAQIWVWNKATGESRRLSDLIARPFFGFERLRWTPNGRGLLAKVLPQGTTVEQANAAGLPLRGNANTGSECTAIEVGSTVIGANKELRSASTSRARYLSDLVLLDVATGQARLFASGVRATWYEASPDGSQVAYAELVDAPPSTLKEYKPRLKVVSLADGGETFRADDLHAGASWSPDGRMLGYSASSTEYRIVDLVDGRSRLTCAGVDEGYGADLRSPLWTRDGHRVLLRREDELWCADGEDWTARRVPTPEDVRIVDVFACGRGSVFWSPDGGKSAIVSTRETASGTSALCRVNLESGELVELIAKNATRVGQSGYGMDVTEDGTRFLYTVEDVASPPDLWVSESSFASSQRVTHLNPRLDDMPMGRSRGVEWVSATGEPLRGALLLPAAYEEGRRYPLIVSVYAGWPPAENANRYAILGNPGLDFTDLQLLATRGYAVFVPEIAPAHGPGMMEGHAESVMPGIDKLVDMGIADDSRLGVIGHSHGGYGVLSLIVRTTRFKAAVASASFADWVATAMLGSFWHRYARDMLGAGLWEDRERYIANSPLHFLDRVDTPVLLVQGALDPATPPAFAQGVFTSLQALGKEAWCVRYEGEDHWPGGWGYANRLDYTNRVLAWFDRYLGFGTDAGA